MIRFVRGAASALRRALLGISPEEIRYTFEDVRRELRATRLDVAVELDAIRKDLAALRSGTEPRQDRRDERAGGDVGGPAAKA